jgi:hypothetical protein
MSFIQYHEKKLIKKGKKNSYINYLPDYCIAVMPIVAFVHFPIKRRQNKSTTTLYVTSTTIAFIQLLYKLRDVLN